MSEMVTMDKDLLIEVMAQAMMRANAQRYGLPSRAAGEQSNIANRTEYYGLPLPTGNEVIAYQDFINDANNIIDGALHSLQNTLDTVSTTANNAADGVAAADTKIQELVQANLDNESASLPQFKQDTDVRLESLENDVMGLTGWSKFLTTTSGSLTENVLKSSIGVYVAAHSIETTAWDNITESVITYINGSNLDTFTVKSLWGNAPGNIFNLKVINTMYAFTTYATENGGEFHIVGYGVKWNGVQTEFYDLGRNITTKLYLMDSIVPMTPMRNVAE